MGGKSGDKSASRAQSRLANQLVQESSPLRNALLSNYSQAFGISPVQNVSVPGTGNPLIENLGKNPQNSGNEFSTPQGVLRFDPGGSPVFSAGRDVLNQQFQNAENNIIASTAPGGALLDRLADNEVQQAISIGNLASGVTESELNRAIQLATGTTSAAQSGFGSAAAAQAQQAQADAQSKSGTGQALGTVAAAGLLKGSDKRIKENLERIGMADNGLPIYIGNYIGSKRKQLFVIAQDVEDISPQAVTEINGVKFVNHGEIQWRQATS